MQVSRKIIIEKSADEIWEILANQFVPVELWTASIKASSEIKTGTKAAGAPVVGRIAAIGPAAAKGASLKETITLFDAANKRLVVDTDIINMPGVSPMNGYTSDIQITTLNSNSCEVTWTSVAKLSFLGYILYIPIKASLSKGFYRNLEELKAIVETGNPHPRKQEAFKEFGLTPELQSV